MFRKKPVYEDLVINSQNKNKSFKPNSRVYRGISTVNPQRGNILLYDIELIKQDLLNHFHVRQGELLSDPNFGTIVWDILHEPMTPTLRNLIIENVNDIIQNDPRVTIDNVIVDEYESGIQIFCNLVYLPYNIQESMQLSFDKNAGFLSE